MTKGEAINQVEAWFKKLSGEVGDTIIKTAPVEAIKRVVKEAKKNG